MENMEDQSRDDVSFDAPSGQVIGAAQPVTKKKGRGALMAVVLVLVLALAGGLAFLLTSKDKAAAPVSQEQQLQKVKVKLKWVHNAQFAGMYYAQKQGIYKEHGLDVEFEEWTQAKPSATKAVHEKEVQFAVSSGTDIITHRANFDRNVVGIATIFQHDPEGYVALKSSGITSLKDVAGKKVGLFPGKTSYIWQAILKEQNLSDLKFSQVNMDFATLPKPETKVLTDKQVDVYATFLTDQAVRLQKEVQAKGDDIVTFNAYDYGVATYNDTIITHADTIKNNPELVQKFVSATVDGWKAAIKNPEQAVAATRSYDGEEYDQYEADIFKAEVPFIQTNDNPLLWTDAKVWNDMYRLLDQNKVLKKTYDVKEAFDTKFIRTYYNAN